MHLIKKALLGALLSLLGLGGAFYYWAHRPLTLEPARLDLTIEPRSSARNVARQLVHGGVPVDARFFLLMARLLGLTAKLKSGSYEFTNGITPYAVLQRLARGDVNQAVVTVIDGWTFARMRAEIDATTPRRHDASPALRHDTIQMSAAELLHAIGATQAYPQGLFFPDSYLFDKGSSDLDIYRRAYQLGQARLQTAWKARAPDLPYKIAYEALIVASLIEKETGRAIDLPRVAAVFVNRLRIGAAADRPERDLRRWRRA